MSVKNVLPILGVGSAFAILGLAVARRQSPPERHAKNLRSGVHPRVDLLRHDGEDELPGVPVLTSEFWDAPPESYAADSQTVQDDPMRPGVYREGYDELDRDDLTGEWLARATQAPSWEEIDGGDADDPAEIPADSLSMISDASRNAAAFEGEDSDEDSDEEQL